MTRPGGDTTYGAEHMIDSHMMRSYDQNQEEGLGTGYYEESLKTGKAPHGRPTITGALLKKLHLMIWFTSKVQFPPQRTKKVAKRSITLRNVSI